jgi:predicted membrane protein
MDKSKQRLLAVGLILFGGLMIASNFLDISFGKVTWALIVIFVGVVLITKPEIFRFENVQFKFVGDIDLDESWTVGDYNLRAFVTDIDLDLEFAEFPDGVTKMNFSSFVADLSVTLPKDVGLNITTNSFLTESKIPGNKGDIFFSGLRYRSEGYEEAVKKLDIQLNGFVIEVSV